MTRRIVLGGIAAGAAALGMPRGARPQPAPVPVIGILRNNPNDTFETFTDQFRQDMGEFGWRDGRNVRLIFRWADGHTDNLPALARDLAANQPKVMLAFGPIGLRALAAAGPQIPIVGMSDDMVTSGFAETMARPGGHTTGVSIFAAELEAKRLELLCELVPQARRVGVLLDPRVSVSRGTHLATAARVLGVELIQAEADTVEGVGPALDALIAAQVDAVNVLASTILNAARAVTIARLRAASLPAVHQWPETAAEGGLVAYGPSLRAIYRQLAVFTDKILRGARPADLPIEHPTKLDLVINLREARRMGLEVPPSILLRADEVIE